ncbi:Mu-like prophage major head subunit gpT family protein [Acuticoccus sp. MNP-M23]|uniref:phage major capsid protein n=1 Tax=Acuticoccus sp. MNP-M23 TaxID=3072793 RepID=UPI002815C383|nr:Mu-like prophage major head subunit gpT family protein [Acuticoccus sp. MNP-M23]WMS42286.1 Mu-like prophage major head subunit gpT family protein [Acuticoccus sp. MNP-M23]
MTYHQRARITGDQRDRFREGATRALLARSGMPSGEQNEYTGMSLMALAQQAVMLATGKASTNPASDALGLSMAAGGMQSTSDFVNILANVANKSMLKGYNEVEETFHLWTARGELQDFRPASRIDLSSFPSLSEVPEGAEYKYAQLSGRSETIQLATYGRMFAITRHAIINDDIGVFTRIPNRMGRAARRTIGNLVYAILTGNPALSDGIPLFHADHGNLAGSGGVPSVPALDAARSSMAVQTSAEEAGIFGTRPRFLLVPVGLQGTASVVVGSEFDHSAATLGKPNTVRGMAEVISDPRLDLASASAWYLAADPNSTETIEVAYLGGQDTPTIEQQPGWASDGVEFKVRIDAGVKAMGWRGLYRNPGE